MLEGVIDLLGMVVEFLLQLSAGEKPRSKSTTAKKKEDPRAPRP